MQPPKKFGDGPERPRRFYASVEARPSEAGHGVFLDGRAPKTPAGRPLVVPTAGLAALIAGEWSAQGETVVLPDMPATRLAYTALDRVAGAHAETAAEVARYAGSDLVCYFADGPEALVERQARRWGAVLDWAESDLGLRFVRVTAVVHQAQPAETLARIEAAAAALDDFALAGLAMAAGLLGSTVLALAMLHDKLDGEAAFDLSRLDAVFQQEQWGVDEEAAERAERLKGEAVLLERWFAALRV